MTKRVWYHKNCLDGFTAAWVFYKKYGPGATFVPVQYGDDIPEYNRGDSVYILDFSWPREKLLELKDGLGPSGFLQVLDHHESARKDLEGLPFCYFDMERSGAGLAWDYFYRVGYEFDGTKRVDRPPIVKYVEDRDLWKFQYENTKAVNAYLETAEMCFETWSSIDTDLQIDGNIEDWGRSILKYQNHMVQEMAKQAEPGMIGGYPCLFVTAPILKSEVCDYLLSKHEDMEIAVAVSIGVGSPDIYMSLRSRPGGPDVSDVARVFGGGGHKNAAGVRTTKEVLEHGEF